MSGFVASPPCAAPDLDAPDADAVAGDAFYPGVSIADFRASIRLGTVVTDTRARDALRGAMISVRGELRCWKASQVAGGHDTLAGVSDETVDGQPVLQMLYRRAVFAYAAADLAETHHDITATRDGKRDGNDSIEERVLSADDHRRNATHAIRDIIGATRTAVELI